ncbi:Major facilitator superfamily domain general substrate transporter [Penicillium concentricum]|uniref:Major facilitator superfamily domain general substrate transporter n=1 Tax=Penicillium concentricum TaxID=293559 RepID=A0A9W9RTF5_9EURO|nr:Major facilitator superfamily domain general substrate transporter [Penicillium concentricum]KAJ5365916.1 Major facilitator superfamily domain general substrate transporter [Penicillium concentricum]
MEKISSDPPQQELLNDAPDEGDSPSRPPASTWTVVSLTIALCLGILCMSLDVTIITTAIPRIADQFDSLSDVGWYGSSFLLTNCATTLAFGKLYTFYSTKWVYLSALFLFEVGSLICGATPNSLGLILGRCIAGVGAGGIFSGSLLIIAQTVPLHRRPIFTALLGAMYGIASVAGPPLGGALTDHVSWRWCFYINLPLGAVTTIFVLLFFHAPDPVKRRPGFRKMLGELDPLGTFFFLPAIICLLLALQWGGAHYAWNNPRIIALFVLSGVLLIAFVAVQIYQNEKATLPPRIVCNRNIWSAAWFSITLNGAYFTFAYYLPIWFQAIKAASATKSGIMNLPSIIAVVIVSVVSGTLVTIFGYYNPIMIMASITLSVGAGLLSTLDVDSGSGEWIGYQILMGMGVGFGMQQPFILVQNVLADEDVPIGTAVATFAQTLGGAIFISVGQNVFQNQFKKAMHLEDPSVDIAKILAAGTTTFRKKLPVEQLPAVLRSYNTAITQAFYVGVALAALSILGTIALEWKSVKKPRDTTLATNSDEAS